MQLFSVMYISEWSGTISYWPKPKEPKKLMWDQNVLKYDWPLKEVIIYFAQNKELFSKAFG